MPNVMINGCNYYYEEHGTGAHTVVFAHGLLLSGRVYHNQVVALRDRFRCLKHNLGFVSKDARSPEGELGKSLARRAKQANLQIRRCSPTTNSVFSQSAEGRLVF